MTSQLALSSILFTAAFAGFYHTLVGPDHYLPFVALGKARNWSYFKTMVIMLLCGIAHVASSVIIGVVGIAIGSSVGMLESIEGGRADIVKWLLMGFAVAYMIYGIKQGLSKDIHEHSDGVIHSHGAGEDYHSHSSKSFNSTTFWTMFIIFAFGPCEVLIPLVMYPASQFDWAGVVSTSLVFSAATIATMSVMVTIFYYGVNIVPIDFSKLAKWRHAISGAVIAMCAGLMFAGL